MLTEGPTSARNVYGRSRDCTESWQKLTEGPAAARKVDRSCWKVLQMHGKVDGRSAVTWKVDGY